ncbi:MAG: metallophosphoesterase [Muribaculaceae bacterium]|nr:metallophosphoesterase [Muribaculaceae bacterium]
MRNIMKERTAEKVHYVIGDIHNEAKKLNSILEQIQPTDSDKVIVLGDIFDRGGEDANPVDVYFMLSGLQGDCIWIRGNHDHWLAYYIKKYFSLPERKREKMPPYFYNSFDLMKQRMTETDMLELADLICGLPLQKEINIDGKKFLFAHAMTSYPSIREADNYYMMGSPELETFFLSGIDGYVSLCGHTVTDNIIWKKGGRFLDEDKHSIWMNEKENVYLMDCGCGFAGGKLACICLEGGERFYE